MLLLGFLVPCKRTKEVYYAKDENKKVCCQAV